LFSKKLELKKALISLWNNEDKEILFKSLLFDLEDSIKDKTESWKRNLNNILEIIQNNKQNFDVEKVFWNLNLDSLKEIRDNFKNLINDKLDNLIKK
jgi:hypothetical protein